MLFVWSRKLIWLSWFVVRRFIVIVVLIVILIMVVKLIRMFFWWWFSCWIIWWCRFNFSLMVSVSLVLCRMRFLRVWVVMIWKWWFIFLLVRNSMLCLRLVRKSVVRWFRRCMEIFCYRMMLWCNVKFCDEIWVEV